MLNKEIHHEQNIEIFNHWHQELKKDFKYEIPKNINLFEQTKFIKKNILKTLEVASKVVNYADENKIFSAKENKKNINDTMDVIRKDTINIAVFGQVGVGKSSFLNMLLGEELLYTNESKATAIITCIRHVDNFEGYENDDIEIEYIGEKELIILFNEALEKLDFIFENQDFTDTFTCEDIQDIEGKKKYLEQYFAKTDFKTGFKPAERKEISLNKALLELISNGVSENKSNLGKTLKSKNKEHIHLIRDEKNVFVTKVIFYKDIELLKGVELIDSPGLGSRSQLDTKKSMDYIKHVDIVLILTDAKEPLEKESELDLLYNLEDVGALDKTFVIVNKIDDCDKTRGEIQGLLKTSLEEMDIRGVKKENIMFVSSMFEFQKMKSVEGLELLCSKIKNIDNITESDKETIEKTIYNFSSKESTQKFLNEKIKEIDELFTNADAYFDNSINSLNTSLEKIKQNIEKFNLRKGDIKIEIDAELERYISDIYLNIEARINYECKDIVEKFFSYEYYEEFAKKGKIFKNAKSDNNEASYNNYRNIAKKSFRDIVGLMNKKLNNDISGKIFTSNTKLEVSNHIMNTFQRIQKKYEIDYNVIIDATNIKINDMAISFSISQDFEIANYKWFKLFINPTIWGKESKYIDSFSEKWEEYCKNVYSKDMENAIKSTISTARRHTENIINKEIKNVIIRIEDQLEEQIRDKEKTDISKEEMYNKKKIVKDFCLNLKETFIQETKNQNQEIFKVGI